MVAKASWFVMMQQMRKERFRKAEILRKSNTVTLSVRRTKSRLLSTVSCSTWGSTACEALQRSRVFRGEGQIPKSILIQFVCRLRGLGTLNGLRGFTLVVVE